MGTARLTKGAAKTYVNQITGATADNRVMNDSVTYIKIVDKLIR